MARWFLVLGIAATLAANVVRGLGHGLTGAAVAAWPTVALVGSYERLIMMVIRSSPVRADGRTEGGCEADPLQEQVAELFAGSLPPTGCVIRAQFHVGQPRAQRLREYLAAEARKHEDKLAA